MSRNDLLLGETAGARLGVASHLGAMVSGDGTCLATTIDRLGSIPEAPYRNLKSKI